MDLHREIKALQAELREIRALQQQQEIRALQQQQHHRVQTLQARKAREQQQTQVANAHKFAQDDVTFGVSMPATAKKRGARGKGNSHIGSHTKNNILPCIRCGKLECESWNGRWYVGENCPKVHPAYLEAKRQRATAKEADAKKERTVLAVSSRAINADAKIFEHSEEESASQGDNCLFVPCAPDSVLPALPVAQHLHFTKGLAVLDTTNVPASCFAMRSEKRLRKGGAIDSAATVSCGAPQSGPDAHVVRKGPYLKPMHMKMARGPLQQVDSCSLAFRTVTQDGKSFLLTTPETPGIAARDMEPLVSLRALLEHGYQCHLAIPTKEHLAGCDLCKRARFKEEVKKRNWGGFIRVPDEQGGHFIILRYTSERLWRLPLPGEPQSMRNDIATSAATSNTFATLSELPDNDPPAAPRVAAKHSSPVDHEKQQQKLLHLEEIQSEAQKFHNMFGHFNAALTITSARYHGYHVSKAVAAAIRKLRCADCALGHGNRNPLRTKRLQTDASNGATWTKILDDQADSLPEWGGNVNEQATLTRARLPDENGTRISHLLAAIPVMHTVDRLKPARHVEHKSRKHSDIQRKKVRWDDGIFAMEAALSGAEPPKRYPTHDDNTDQALKNIGIPLQGELCEPTIEEISESSRQTSEQDVGTDIRIDFADAISMGYQHEKYYLLAVDKESDFLYSIPSTQRADAYVLLKEYLEVTGFRPSRLRCDNAPEFKSEKFLKLCEESNISIQYVEAYNHTMNGRIENCVKIVKSHVRAALSASNAPRNFWPDCTKDLINKYNNLVKRTNTGHLLTPYERVKPKALSNRLSDVFVPFGCKAVGVLPKEHPLIKNTSHQNRGYEGIFLRKDDTSEQVWLYVFALRKRMLFRDVQYYKEQFPFRNHGCLSNPKLMDPCLKDLGALEVPSDSPPALPLTRAKAAEHDDLVKQAERIISDENTEACQAPVVPATPGGSQFLTPPSSPPSSWIIPAVDMGSPEQSPARGQLPKAKRFMEGRDIPLEHPWEQLTWLQRCKALAHHEVVIPLPPGTLPGRDVPGLPLFGKSVRAYNGGPKKSRQAFLEIRVMKPHPRAGDLVPLRADMPGEDTQSVAHAIWCWKPNLTCLQDFGIQKPSASDSTKALLALLQDAGLKGFHAVWSATTHAPPEASHNSSSFSLQVDKFVPDPRNRNAMLRGPVEHVPFWKESETKEMEGLKARGCIKRVHRRDLIDGVDKVFQSRFHYKIKRHADGTLNKFKVRLVCQGQHMQKSVDYADAFSPVPHASGFRTLVALAAANDMEMDQVDISQAFIQGDLLPGDGRRGRVFIAPPPGYPEEENIVWQLMRPLYGMPQSARCWHLTMSKWLKDEGFHTVGYEKSMWCIQKDGHKIIMGSHIDDFIICSTSREMLDDFRKRLIGTDGVGGRFDGTYEGPLDHYLGCEIRRDRPKRKAIITQANYARHILESEGMWDCNPKLTPMMPNTRLSKADQPSVADPVLHKRYRGLVGKLGYLVNMTRPDLAWAYSQLSSFVQCPGEVHMAAAMHVLAYLRGTYDRCLTYSKPPGTRLNTLWGWVDSDWAADQDTRRSHTGYVLMLNGGAISWRSRRQDSVSLSTSEAEYIAASQCGQEVVYLREILRESFFEQAEETLVYEDNRACILMSENSVSREKSRHVEPIQRLVAKSDLPRHVDIRRRFLRELVGLKVLKLLPCSTHKMVADALTKSLPEPAFRMHRAEMLGEADMPYCAYLLHVMRPSRARGCIA
jgi:hypothetical protein